MSVFITALIFVSNAKDITVMIVIIRNMKINMAWLIIGAFVVLCRFTGKNGQTVFRCLDVISSQQEDN